MTDSPKKRMAFRAISVAMRGNALLHFWPPSADPFSQKDESDPYRSLTPECDLIFRLDKIHFHTKLVNACLADPLVDTSIAVQKALGVLRNLKLAKDIYP